MEWNNPYKWPKINGWGVVSLLIGNSFHSTYNDRLGAESASGISSHWWNWRCIRSLPKAMVKDYSLDIQSYISWGLVFRVCFWGPNTFSEVFGCIGTSKISHRDPGSPSENGYENQILCWEGDQRPASAENMTGFLGFHCTGCLIGILDPYNNGLL